MNIALHIPEVNDAQMTFGVKAVNKYFLVEAERRGFFPDTMHKTPHNKLFSDLFFGNTTGKDITYKEGLDDDFKRKALRYLQANMVSFGIKHEHKEAVCSLLLSELVEAGGEK